MPRSDSLQAPTKFRYHERRATATCVQREKSKGRAKNESDHEGGGNPLHDCTRGVLPRSIGGRYGERRGGASAVDLNWAKAYNSGNADAVASLYDEQAVLLPPGAPAVSGRAAIKAFFAKDTAESQKAGVTFTLGPKPAGGVSGDMGWQSGSYAVKDKAGKTVETGKYLSVSTKKDGKWLYVRDTWNADGAAAPADSAAPAKK